MPYIKQEDRDRFFAALRELKASGPITTPGELNYVISSIINTYLIDNGVKYQTIAEVTGALVNAKDEFTRRVVAQYEDKKAFENGDVYTVSSRRTKIG